MISKGVLDSPNRDSHKTSPDEVLRLTGGKGVDLLVEVTGAEMIEQSLKAARLGRTVAVIWILIGQEGGLSPGDSIWE